MSQIDPTVTSSPGSNSNETGNSRSSALQKKKKKNGACPSDAI